MASTYTGVLSSTCVSIARDCMSGDTSDYIFFCPSDNNYLLVRYKSFEELQSGAIQYNDCVVTHIEYQPSNWQQNIPTDYFLDTYSQQVLIVDNADNQLVYSSEEGYPHLVEGGAYYGFAACCLLVGYFCFRLVRRIFYFVG